MMSFFPTNRRIMVLYFLNIALKSNCPKKTSSMKVQIHVYLSVYTIYNHYPPQQNWNSDFIKILHFSNFWPKSKQTYFFNFQISSLSWELRQTSKITKKVNNPKIIKSKLFNIKCFDFGSRSCIWSKEIWFQSFGPQGS